MQSKVHATNAHTLGFRLFCPYIYTYIINYIYNLSIFTSTHIYTNMYKLLSCSCARETTGMPEEKLKERTSRYVCDLQSFAFFSILSICSSKILYIYDFYAFSTAWLSHAHNVLSPLIIVSRVLTALRYFSL